MIPGLTLLLFFFSFVLIKSADLIVVALRRLSRKSSSTAFVLSALILALATSFPELSVAITSSLDKTPALSLGNIMGANIANISLVAGLAALAVGKVRVHGQFLKRDVLIALVAGIMPIILVVDGELSRVDGLLLLVAYGAYASSFFKRRFIEIAQEHKKESFIHRFLRQFNHIDGNKSKEAGRLFIGVALLLASANLLVMIARQLAIVANIPIFLVGLIIISIGTTLPELAFSFRSLEDGEPTMFFGNILGSIIANSTLVVGVAGLIYPVKIVAINEYFVAAGAFVVIFLTFWLFIKSKLRLDRWEAGVLFALYFAFVLVEFFL
ncbi:sodium:calcium antiporter [Patescibacteria group bacterium]